MSENKLVYKAISDVMAELSKTGIAKGQTNSQQKYNFRGIDDVYNTMAPIMAEKKIIMLPEVLARESEWVESDRTDARTGEVRKTRLHYVTLTVAFNLISSEDGSSHRIVTCGEAMDSGDKATNKAMSAALKYACLQSFMIPTEGDNDPDATTHVAAPIHRFENKDERISELRAKIKNASTVKEISDMVDVLNAEATLTISAKQTLKAELQKHASDLGINFNLETKKWEKKHE